MRPIFARVKPMSEPLPDQTIYDEDGSLGANIIDASTQDKEKPVLIILDGGDLKNRYPISRKEFSVGRDIGCEIAITDSKISRRHAVITYHNIDSPDEAPHVTIRDNGSTNGTFVNGSRVTEVELKDRDKVTIGSVLFGFFLKDETTMKADENLIRLATLDPLTNLNNRGVFNMEIDREFDRARRYRRDLTLVMFDIDHFKKFNDTYGHQAGDEILRSLGRLVLVNCRSNDIATRYGGEEFAVVLPETPLENALVQAERLRKSVASHEFEVGDKVLQVTVSVGMAMLEPFMSRAEDLIEAADQALYRAKESGRNQVCWHRGDPRERLDGTSH